MARKCALGGFIGSPNYGGNIEYPFGDRTDVVVFVRDPKGVKVLVTFDAETTHLERQQRQGRQASLNDFSKHVEASR